MPRSGFVQQAAQETTRAKNRARVLAAALGFKMGWEDDHKQRVAQFPEAIRKAHLHSSNHRAEIEASEACGCFYCRSIFKPADIKEWIDENTEGIGQTAMCPRCGIDSVIGSKSGFPIDTEFLGAMKRTWF